MEGHVIALGRDDVVESFSVGAGRFSAPRAGPFVHGNGYASVAPTLEAHGIDAVDRRSAATDRSRSPRLLGEGLAVVGVPKTIDNDIVGTDVTFGFDTAVQIATDAHRPAAHHRREPTTG